MRRPARRRSGRRDRCDPCARSRRRPGRCRSSGCASGSCARILARLQQSGSGAAALAPDEDRCPVVGHGQFAAGLRHLHGIDRGGGPRRRDAKAFANRLAVARQPNRPDLERPAVLEQADVGRVARPMGHQVGSDVGERIDDRDVADRDVTHLPIDDAARGTDAEANTGSVPGVVGTGVDAAPSLTSTMPTNSPAAARSAIAVTAPPRSEPRPLPVRASSDGTSRRVSDTANTRRSKLPSSSGRKRPATSWRARCKRVSMPCLSGNCMLRESSTTRATARPVAAAAGTSLTGRNRIRRPARV